MYLHMRVLNPDIPQIEIVNHFLKYSQKELARTMLRYNKHVEVTLKNHNLFEYDIWRDYDRDSIDLDKNIKIYNLNFLLKRYLKKKKHNYG